MDTNKRLELEALAAVGEMLLFDKARGNPEEAKRIMRCASIFVRSDDAAKRLSELCAEAGSDATWHEKRLMNCKTARTCKPKHRNGWQRGESANE